jgi:16S rRNA A1518/A1519 N6-dimethyltransferase RsmA/KsgA/DIM1 with predicted DNA glycosylase/AP lyase activity
MKKLQTKLFFPPPNVEQMVIDINKENALGWRFIHAIQTQAGIIFMMERTTDEDVNDADVEAYEKAKKEAELLAQFGPGPIPPKTVSDEGTQHVYPDVQKILKQR